MRLTGRITGFFEEVPAFVLVEQGADVAKCCPERLEGACSGTTQMRLELGECQLDRGPVRFEDDRAMWAVTSADPVPSNPRIAVLARILLEMARFELPINELESRRTDVELLLGAFPLARLDDKMPGSRGSQ